MIEEPPHVQSRVSQMEHKWVVLPMSVCSDWLYQCEQCTASAIRLLLESTFTSSPALNLCRTSRRHPLYLTQLKTKDVT